MQVNYSGFNHFLNDDKMFGLIQKLGLKLDMCKNTLDYIPTNVDRLYVRDEVRLFSNDVMTKFQSRAKKVINLILTNSPYIFVPYHIKLTRFLPTQQQTVYICPGKH